jgi:uncharacterized damage-inducible protein DinB
MAPNDVPETFDERTTLTTMLTYAREIAISKAAGLKDEQAAQAPLSTSPLMTIGGLLHHLTWVERDWIDRRLLGGPDEGPWTEEEPDREYTVGATTPLADVIAEYREQTARLDARVADLDLDTPAAMPLGDGSPITLRWILFHLVEETSRHNGHLDIIRELVDGTVGD